MTCFLCIGSLTSWSMSMRAFSRCGFSAMWRSIVVPAGGCPRLSQLDGEVVQECFVCIFSHGGELVRLPREKVARAEST